MNHTKKLKIVICLVVMAMTSLSNAFVLKVNKQLTDELMLTIYYKDDKPIAVETLDHQGNLIGKKGIIPDGEVKQFYEDGSIRDVYNIKNNKIEGKNIGYYPSGQIMWKSFYKKGLKHGIAKSYYEDGNIQIIMPYSKGKLNGVAKDYYKNGNINSSYKFKNDKKQGKYFSYYSNGVLKEKGFFKKDKPFGKFKSYDISGNLNDETNFSDEKEMLKREKSDEYGRKMNSDTREQIDSGKIYFSGGNGDSIENAIIINGATGSRTGVTSEYLYLDEKFGDRGNLWELQDQKLISDENRMFDVINIKLIKTGENKTFYFDVTNFFGKFE